VNLGLLDHHYRTEQDRAEERYLEAQERQGREYWRGLLTREEYREVVEEVREAETEYEAAVMRHTRVWLLCEAVARAVQLPPLPAPEPLELVSIPHRAENDHAPPLRDLAHSISSHGPPSYATNAARLLALTR